MQSSLFESGLPSLNVIVIGDDIIRKEFIKFWLSVGSRYTEYIYNKIIWVDSKPIQLNVKEISFDNILNSDNHCDKYQSVIFLLTSKDQTNKILKINNKSDKFLFNFAFKGVIDFTNSEYNVDYFNIYNLCYYTTKFIDIETLFTNLDSITEMKKIVNIITQETCSYIPDMYFLDNGLSSGNYDEYSNLEIEDNKYIDYNITDSLLGDKKKKYNCCNIF